MTAEEFGRPQVEPSALGIEKSTGGKASGDWLPLGYCVSARVADDLRLLLHRDHSAHGRLVFVGLFVALPACRPSINIRVGF